MPASIAGKVNGAAAREGVLEPLGTVGAGQRELAHLDAALAVDEPLTTAELRSRDGIRSRQITLR